VVAIQHSAPPATADAPSAPTVQTRVLWDRKIDGGFPETKELKRRVRDVIEPGRNLGHVDRDHRREKEATSISHPPKEKQTDNPQGASGHGAAMPEEQQEHQQQSNSGGSSAPRWPTSVSALQAQSQGQQPEEGSQQTNPDPIRKGHSRPMIPATDDPVNVQSRSWKKLPPQSTAQQGGEGDKYQPKMAGGGSMPVVKPAGGARNEEVRGKMEESSRRKEDCEDCQ
jgi:hypothetical protein